ncbi:MAG: peptide ABC transporter substrate-binding protein [Carnobacterium sp.]
MNLKNKLIGLSWLALVSTLMACGNSDTSKDSSSNRSQKENKQKISIMAEQEIGSMNTLASQDSDGFIAQNQVFEGLYTLDEKDNIIPAVALDMPEISEDGLTYTIKLREDSVWSNGDPVTAHDFIYAWKRLANPETAANYGFLVDGTILNGSDVLLGKKGVNELGVKALDDYTVELTLENPVPYFTSLLAFNPFYPQNEKFVTSEGNDYAMNSEHMLYNGPFVMEDWSNASTSWKFVKNDQYWDSKSVKADEINFQVIKEVGTAINLYDSKQLDFAFVSGEYASQRKDDPDFVATPSAYVYYFKLNQLRDGKDTIFANKNVRKAFGYAVDKESLVDSVLKDGSKAVYGFVPSDFVKNPETGEDYRKEAGDFLVTDKKEALKHWK